jgi:hypothetical protein
VLLIGTCLLAQGTQRTLLVRRASSGRAVHRFVVGGSLTLTLGRNLAAQSATVRTRSLRPPRIRLLEVRHAGLLAQRAHLGHELDGGRPVSHSQLARCLR